MHRANKVLADSATPEFAVGPQYDTTHVYVAPQDFDRFVASLKADISSGDHPANHTLGTFNPIYPIGNYFGVFSDTGPGAVNFIDVHPRIQTQLTRSISLSTDVVVQWRESLNDGVYAVPGSSVTGRARKSLGRLTGMLICKLTMEFFTLASFSRKPWRERISTTSLYGPGISFDQLHKCLPLLPS
jgi:hypothetical protein